MTTKETIETLEKFNAWRRGDELMEMPSPKLIGQAIDSAIEKIKTIEDEKIHKNIS
jgi:hypothetical protein